MLIDCRAMAQRQAQGMSEVMVLTGLGIGPGNCAGVATGCVLAVPGANQADAKGRGANGQLRSDRPRRAWGVGLLIEMRMRPGAARAGARGRGQGGAAAGGGNAPHRAVRLVVRLTAGAIGRGGVAECHEGRRGLEWCLLQSSFGCNGWVASFDLRDA